jgi:hypothetical protein
LTSSCSSMSSFASWLPPWEERASSEWSPSYFLCMSSLKGVSSDA